MPNPLYGVLKISRWHKKQLLGKSQAHVTAQLRARGHRIQASLSSCRIAQKTASANGDVFVSAEAISLAGFRALGGGLFKLGHTLWSMETLGEDVVLKRSEEVGEPKDAAAFPKRRASFTPGDVIDIAGLPATVHYLAGPSRVAVEFLGSGIRDIQPVASILDEVANDAAAHFDACIRTRCAMGAFSSAEFERELSHLLNAYSVDNDLSTPDHELAKGISLALAEVARSARRASRHTAQNEWILWNSLVIRDYTSTLIGEVTLQDAGYCWELAQAGQVVANGCAPDEETAKSQCDAKAIEFGGESTPSQRSALSVANPAALIGTPVRNTALGTLREGVVVGVIPGFLKSNDFKLEVQYEDGNFGTIDPDVWMLDDSTESLVCKHAQQDGRSPWELGETGLGEYTYRVHTTVRGAPVELTVAFDEPRTDREPLFLEMVIDKYVSQTGDNSEWSEAELGELQRSINVDEVSA